MCSRASARPRSSARRMTSPRPLKQGDATSFASVVKRRRMIRKYADKPLPEEAINQLLQYAVRAPSAGNLQPWEFIIVRAPEVRAKLAKAAMHQNSVATAPVIIATCADIQRMGEKYGTRGAFYSLVDTAFASLLILLGATERGLGPVLLARTIRKKSPRHCNYPTTSARSDSSPSVIPPKSRANQRIRKSRLSN